MGCGSSKVNAIDNEAIDDEESVQQNTGNGIKTSIIEEKDQKAVQFSSGVQSNGQASNEGKSKHTKYNILLGTHIAQILNLCI